MSEIFLSQSLLRQRPEGGRGEVVTLDGETFYRIGNFDAMPPFFMTVVSAFDHWMFVSSTGGLTCGRRDPGNALFPYVTDDKVHDAGAHTGPLTGLLVDDGERTQLWKPFCREVSLYRLTRNLYKNLEGNRLVFEEVNHDLGLSFSYGWSTGEKLGFIRHAHLVNSGERTLEVRLLDGIRNLLPAGVDPSLQAGKSTLVDAYKRAEAVEGLPAAIFSLSSILTDRAEPNEALEATLAWCSGLDHPGVLLTEDQFRDFCLGNAPREEHDSRGKRGAFFVFDTLALPADGKRDWYIVADVKQGPADVPALLERVRSGMTAEMIEREIGEGTRRLRKLVGSADGLQSGADALTTGRHFSNTLFNIMRGGVFDRAYKIPTDDFIGFVKDWHKPLAAELSVRLALESERVSVVALSERALADGDPDLQRLVLEYLPLTFSRRHGDPSRPWNQFSIELRKADGSDALSYQGNWRDIFQNWEALAWSYPGFIEHFIAKFVNASTVDGFNAYRISRDGFDWEVLDPSDPWSNIGYWGDHQVGYLHRLLDLSRRYHPGRLETLLAAEIFVYADVPYRLRQYAELLRDPRNTVDYDEQRADQIGRRVERLGTDGQLVVGPGGGILRVNLLEKLLVPALAKIGSLVPGGGVWMNTQRPEWNDANNALVGFGLSMVTACYLRTYLVLLEDVLQSHDAERYTVTTETADAFVSLERVLRAQRNRLKGDFGAADRRAFMDAAGAALDHWRNQIYSGFTGSRGSLARLELIAFIGLAREWIDHSIASNRRTDGLYHSYNLLRMENGGVEVDRLDAMLEGQVAVLNSGFLAPEECLALLDCLRASALYRPDQDSYLLYPDRALPGFLEKNVIPAEWLSSCDWVRQALDQGGMGYLERDVRGEVHFAARFRNAAVLASELRKDTALEPGQADWLLETFEKVFHHQRFTGRSGSMYKYEGLGCIYWHMVSKLALAVAEVSVEAQRTGVDATIVDHLALRYREIREGLGLHKTPAEYGAFPTDPYSHTPGFAGVQQPGLTGQVKEDVIARFTQLGVEVEGGAVRFAPVLMESGEFLKESVSWRVVTDGGERSLDLPAGSFGFTLCGVPVIYRMAEEAQVEVVDSEGQSHRLTGNSLGPDWSGSLCGRDGTIDRLVVDVPGPVLRQGL